MATRWRINIFVIRRHTKFRLRWDACIKWILHFPSQTVRQNIHNFALVVVSGIILKPHIYLFICEEFYILFVSEYYVFEVHLLDHFHDSFKVVYNVPALKNFWNSVIKSAPTDQNLRCFTVCIVSEFSANKCYFLSKRILIYYNNAGDVHFSNVKIKWKKELKLWKITHKINFLLHFLGEKGKIHELLQ